MTGDEMDTDVEGRALEFVNQVVRAMGLSLEGHLERTRDGACVNLDGEGGDVLLARRGEALQALQYLVDSVFRRQLEDDRRILVDCLGFRRDKDAELRQMARFLAGRAKSTHAEQTIGPLNAYDRRIVHLAVAEDPDVASESVGDAAVKTVIISEKTKKP
jgi:spoIIIJ-associated protein